MSLLNSSELDDSDLENVAGGWFWDDIKNGLKSIKNRFCRAKEQAVKVKEAVSQLNEVVNEFKNFNGIGK